MREFDEPDGELIAPEDLLGPDRIPHDARRMGCDRHTEEGAMIALASSLDPAKLSHRIVAWVLLVALALPMLMTVVAELL